MSEQLIIGLVGGPSSGKDTVAAYLVDTHHFRHFSTSDYVRFYATEHELGEHTRELLQDVANVLRSEHGADYLMKMALENDAPLLVISGLRTAAEATLLKERGGVLVALSAPQKVRYQRALERSRIGEGITFEEFQAIEEKEAANPNPAVQNVAAAVAMADFTLNNSGDLSTLHREVDDLLETLRKKQ